MKAIKVKLTENKLHIPLIGDIQYGNEGFVEGKLTHFMDVCQRYIKEKRSNTWFVGTGDYIDFMSPSNRAAYRFSGIYSSSKRLISHGTTIPQMEELYELIKPMKGRTAALCVGHHWAHFDFMGMDLDKRRAALHLLPKDFPDVPPTTDDYLGAILGSPVSDDLGMNLVSFAFPGGAKYRLLAWHGEGNGGTMGYMINKLAKLSGGWEKINAIAAGHTHRLLGGFDVKLRPSDDDDDILDRNIPLVNSGSYLRAYLLNDQAYPEGRGLPALALGSAVLTVEPYQRKGEWQFHTEISLHA